MCGIAGIFNLDGSIIDQANALEIRDKMAHRGPDGKGAYFENNLALLHRRLAILDPSDSGAQPMHSSNSKWVIVFNGCIYNFKKLRKELEQKGISFKSNSDTEVIVEGLSFYGPDFFQRFDGMFAIAAWNKKTKELILSRDRYGIKPLYFWFDGKKVVFASEIKAIITHSSYKIDVDLDALNEYFTFQNIFSYNTLFKGVSMLPPANTLIINKETKKITHNSWWDYDFNKNSKEQSFKQTTEELRDLFEKAVNRQLVSDVPVGSYLSGGMDSGSITAIASKKIKRLPTFTCGFDMNGVTGRESNFDERKDAELMANYFKTEQFEQVINAGDIKWSLPKLVYHLEDLRVGMSYPNFYISRLASKFVKVCLQGTGGDELFGGYPWRYYKAFGSLTQKDYFNNYYEFWQRLVSDGEKKDLFVTEVFDKINPVAPRKAFEKVFLFNNKLNYDTPQDHINNSFYFEIKTFLSALFMVGDKLSMANGLEERFPFMDNDLVDFAMKIPVKYKLGNLEKEIRMLNENTTGKKSKVYKEFSDGKNILRKAMKNFIPNHIINRKKQGFSAPDESWYRGENADYLKEILLQSETLSTKFINKSFIEKIVLEHINNKKNHRLLIWSFLNFEWWCRIFLNDEKPL